MLCLWKMFSLVFPALWLVNYYKYWSVIGQLLNTSTSLWLVESHLIWSCGNCLQTSLSDDQKGLRVCCTDCSRASCWSWECPPWLRDYHSSSSDPDLTTSHKPWWVSQTSPQHPEPCSCLDEVPRNMIGQYHHHQFQISVVSLFALQICK